MFRYESVRQALGGRVVHMAQLLRSDLYLPRVDNRSGVLQERRSSSGRAVPIIPWRPDDDIIFPAEMQRPTLYQCRAYRQLPPLARFAANLAARASAQIKDRPLADMLKGFSAVANREIHVPLPGRGAQKKTLCIASRPFIVVNMEHIDNMAKRDPRDIGFLMVHELEHVRSAQESPAIVTTWPLLHNFQLEGEAHRIQALAQQGMGLQPDDPNLTPLQDAAFTIGRLWGEYQTFVGNMGTDLDDESVVGLSFSVRYARLTQPVENNTTT